MLTINNAINANSDNSAIDANSDTSAIDANSARKPVGSLTNTEESLCEVRCC